MIRIACKALVVFTFLLLIGCGGNTPQSALDMGGEDGSKISVLVEDINDAIGNPKKLSELFATGVKPPEASKTRGMSFSIVGKPSVTGTSATCKVRIDKGSEKIAEPEWTFEKVGDKWKIKTAPLQ